MAHAIGGLRDIVRGVFPGRALLPPVVAVATYFDDSRKGGIYAVAGYVGHVDAWDEVFAPQWKASIKQAPHPITEFAASDCGNGLGEFRPPWTKPERDSLTERLVSLIINEQSDMIGIGAAVTLPRFIDNDKLREKWERFAYLLCAGTVMSHVAQVCHRAREQDSILFVFDEQKGMQGKAQEMFDEVKADLQAHGHLLCDVAGPLFRSVGISDLGTATRRRVSSVMRSSGVRNFGVRFGVIVVPSGPEAGVYG